jgi:hypothetical protein
MNINISDLSYYSILTLIETKIIDFTHQLEKPMSTAHSVYLNGQIDVLTKVLKELTGE